LAPWDGEIRWQGRPIADDLIAHKGRVGFVPEEPVFYNYLSGKEHLQLVGRLRGLPEPALEARIERLLELLDLLPRQSAPIESYSKGMRQKLAIAAALLHDPELVLFDEAESGLDITSALTFRALISRLAGQGKLVVYSSHVMEIVERVCSRVLILHEGRVVADDTVARLRALEESRSLEAVFRRLVAGESIEGRADALAGALKL
jgi:ABC-2 type transport system ATP-binding protein